MWRILISGKIFLSYLADINNIFIYLLIFFVDELTKEMKVEHDEKTVSRRTYVALLSVRSLY